MLIFRGGPVGPKGTIPGGAGFGGRSRTMLFLTEPPVRRVPCSATWGSPPSGRACTIEPSRPGPGGENGGTPMILRLATMRFSHRLVLLMLLATVPAMLGGICILSQEPADYLEAAAAEKLASTAHHLAEKVDAWLDNPVPDLEFFSHDPDLVSMDPKRQRAALQRFRDLCRQISDAQVFGLDGREVAAAGDQPPAEARRRKCFQDVMAGATVARETLTRSRKTGRPALNYAVPIHASSGKIAGVLVVEIGLEKLSDAARAARSGYTGYSCVVDERGRALAHPRPQHAAMLRELRDLPPVESAIRERVSRAYRFRDPEGVEWLAYAVPLANGWSVVSLQQAAEVLAQARRVVAVALLVMEAVTAVIIGLTWLVAERVVQPIIGMTTTATEIANGDWKRRIAEDRGDELGTLARAFNKMVDQFTLFRRFAETSGQGFGMTDLQGRMTYANPTLMRLCGAQQPSQILGKRVVSFFAKPCRSRLQAEIFPTVMGGGCWVGELQVLAVDGSTTPAIVDGFLIRDESGRPSCLAAVVTDVSEHKRSEEALRKKEEEFRQAQKLEAVGALAGGMAHEFNNLLQAIRAFTQFALKGLSPEEPRYQDLQEVLKASQRAAGLTRQLLGFSRRQPFEPKDVPANEILADLEKMLRPLIGANIELQMMLGEGVGQWHVDPIMIQQAVMNLCINARDAMPAGGKLLIKTENAVLDAGECGLPLPSQPGRYVRLTVSDTGSGMTAEVQEHLFEPFFSTKGVGKGTGLGLSMVYGVVQQHGGIIRVHSQPGRGSTFEIYLPAVEAVAEAAAAPLPAPATAGTETILVAEDDPLVRAALVRTLATAGYRVLAAADGEEAVRLFGERATEISLVALDMIMPRMGGREAHRQIAQMSPDTPVIYCTGYDPDSTELEAADAAALCILQKPVDSDLLLVTVRRLLDRRSPCPLS